MNNILKNTKKFILVLVLLILFNFCYPRYMVRADEESNTQSQESMSKSIGDIKEEEASGEYGYTSGDARDAGGWLDLSTNFASLLFFMERGVIGLVNNIFSDEDHKFSYTVTDLGDYNDIKIDVFISPESIIKGKYLLFNADIFDDVNNDTQDYYDDASDKDTISGRTALRNTISGWYTVLRTFSIVALLSVLVYVGIRMIISTVAQDKAKYKVMFKDWLVALCLLVVMHYIMIAILDMSSMIVDAIGTSGAAASQTELVMEKIGTITAAPKGYNVTYNGKTTEDVRAIYVDENNNLELYTIGDAYAYEFLLVAMLFYTILFAIKYLKREFTIMFLILLGPISCITYPIDKISDGKAQAFNRWFSEFLYQVIIQPFHLLIYIVLVGTATQLANDNLLYSIVCFAVMIPAEKFIKEMFGFKDKLGSPLGAMATGAMAGQVFKNAFSGGDSKNPKSNQVEGKSESNSSIRENKLKPGLPGEESGTGTSENYDYEDRNSPLPGGNNTDTSGDGGENPLPPGGDDADTSGDGDENPLPPGGNDADTSGDGDENPPSPGGDNTDTSVDENGNPLPSGGDNEDASEDGENGTESPNNSPMEEPEPVQTTGIYSPKEKSVSKFKNAVRGVREHRDKKLMAKYGTKNRGILYKDANGKIRAGALGKYMAQKGSKLGKKAIKGATTLAGAAALGTLGLMVGQGSKGALAGASFGANVGNRVNKKMSSGYASAREYGREASYATKSEEERRKERALEMMKTPDQIEKASQSFSKRNGGKIASTSELNQELADRARFKEMKLNDDEIDDAMEIYGKNKADLGEEGALQMAYASANLASRYSAKDFEDPKKMDNAYKKLMREYEALGVNQDLADESVRDIITNAASTYGIKSPALSIPSRKQAYMSNQANIDRARASYARRHNGNGPTNKQQLNQELEMGFNLRKAGISEEDRGEFFDSYITNQDAIDGAIATLGENATEEEINTELERRFEIKVKLNKVDSMSEQELTHHINAAETFVKDNNKIEKPTNGQVYSEVKQRVTVQDSYHISTGSQQEINQRINDIRSNEAKFVKKSEDKDGARAVLSAQRAEVSAALAAQIAENPRSSVKRESKRMQTQAEYQRDFLSRYSAEQMRDDIVMEKAKKKIEKQLEKSGANYSAAYRERFANEVIAKGKQYAGIEE